MTQEEEVQAVKRARASVKHATLPWRMVPTKTGWRIAVQLWDRCLDEVFGPSS